MSENRPRLPWPSSIPGIVGSDIVGGQALVVDAEGNIVLGANGVNIIERRDCSLEPLDPNYQGSDGDGIICEDTGDLWVWNGDEWVNTGPWGNTFHDNLTDVTTDQHHEKSHTQ